MTAVIVFTIMLLLITFSEIKVRQHNKSVSVNIDNVDKVKRDYIVSIKQSKKSTDYVLQSIKEINNDLRKIAEGGG